MRGIHKLILLTLFLLCVGTGALAVWLIRDTQRQNVAVLPTLMVLPSLTPTATASHTPSPTQTATPTNTATAISTPTATATFTPTLTPTLAARLIEIEAVMPGVYVAPRATNFPTGTILLPAPPQPIEPLPDATHEAPPFIGWYSFESDHPLVQYSSPWQPRQVIQASQGQYHRSENTSSMVTFHFEGEGLRIRYVAARNMGMFDIIVDGVLLDTIDAYATELSYPGTRGMTIQGIMPSLS
jgi:hypothetical protein